MSHAGKAAKVVDFQCFRPAAVFRYRGPSDCLKRA
jgi:hypothetical protein